MFTTSYQVDSNVLDQTERYFANSDKPFNTSTVAVKLKEKGVPFEAGIADKAAVQVLRSLRETGKAEHIGAGWWVAKKE